MKKEPISPALFCQEQCEQIAPEKEQISLSRATGANRLQSFFKKEQIFYFFSRNHSFVLLLTKTSDSLKNCRAKSHSWEN